MVVQAGLLFDGDLLIKLMKKEVWKEIMEMRKLGRNKKKQKIYLEEEKW